MIKDIETNNYFNNKSVYEIENYIIKVLLVIALTLLLRTGDNFKIIFFLVIAPADRKTDNKSQTKHQRWTIILDSITKGN